MNQIKYAKLIASTILATASSGWAAPANNNFADAINMPGNSGVLTGTQYNTINATMEVGEPVPAFGWYPDATNTVWFKWTCATSGTLEVSTTGSLNDVDAEWDAVIGIYTGTSVETLTTLLQQDSGTDETADIAVTAGTTYYIQLAGDGGSPPPMATNIRLSWHMVSPVVGTAATLSNGEVLPLDYTFSLGTHQDVWTKFVLTTVGSGDTELIMREGDPDGGGGGWSSYPPRIHTSTSGMWGLGGYTFAAPHVTQANASALAPVAGDVVYCKVHLNDVYPDYYDKKTLSLWINPADTSSEAALGTPAVTFEHYPWYVGRMGYKSLSVTGNAVLSDVVVAADLSNLSAPVALAAHAGSPLALSPTVLSGPLGGSPAASGGSGSYTYAWSPTTGLDDAALPNPTVTTTAATTTYTLTVTDSTSATATSTVIVTYTVPALAAHAGAPQNVSSGAPSVVLGGSPAASGGSGGDSYSWTSVPAGFTSTAANPSVSPTATTTYTLTVTDSTSATATDTVTVTYVIIPSTVLASEDFESYPAATNASSVCVGAYDWVFGTKDGSSIVGKLNGGSGWGEGWNNGGTDASGGSSGATSTSPNFIISEAGPSGKFYDGANASSDNNGFGKSRAFASTIGNSWQSSALSFGANGASVGFSSTSGFWSFHITSNGGNYGLEDYEGSAQTLNHIKAVSTNSASPDLVITKIAGSLVSLWINPASTSSAAALGTPDVTITVAHTGLTAYTVSGKVRVDNILVGTTLADVIVTGGGSSPYATWALAHAGSSTASADGDYNHDGVQNGIAYFMGMNGLASLPGVVDGKVTWPHVGTVSAFEVQVSTNLTNWATAPSGVDLSNPAAVVYTLPTGVVGGTVFCRLVVTP